MGKQTCVRFSYEGRSQQPQGAGRLPRGSRPSSDQGTDGHHGHSPALSTASAPRRGTAQREEARGSGVAWEADVSGVSRNSASPPTITHLIPLSPPIPPTYSVLTPPRATSACVSWMRKLKHREVQ